MRCSLRLCVLAFVVAAAPCVGAETRIGRDPHAVGLFHYAGHGVQAEGNNYLIPVDADIQSEADLDANAFDASRVLRAMQAAQNEMNIVMLDACRDNPLPKTRGIVRGLARMDAPSGTFIAYAAAPGQSAQDGASGNTSTTGAKTRHSRNGTYRLVGTNSIAMTGEAGTFVYQPLQPGTTVNPRNPVMLGAWHATAVSNGVTWDVIIQNNANGTCEAQARSEDNANCSYSNNQWHTTSTVTGHSDGGSYRILNARDIEFTGSHGTADWRRISRAGP